MSDKPKFKQTRDGVRYDLNSVEAAAKSGHTVGWVTRHAEALGGRKESWGDGPRRPATWRYPSRGLATRVKEVEAAMRERQATSRRRVSA